MSASDSGSLIDVALAIWFTLVALSVAYVAWDAFTRNPELRVMRIGWVLVTAYTGPVGAAIYVLACQEPAAGTHERFILPLWKQSVGSTIHCLAGDATGVIVAAAVTAALGLPMGLDAVVEYAFGFAFGLLIFQALFMKTMLGGSYATALRRSFLPEWLSMNAVMAGMVPIMIIIMSRNMSAMEPTSLRFWGVMSLASLAGLALAYPVNVWLVAMRLKHGMGTERVLGKGGAPVAAAVIADPVVASASGEPARRSASITAASPATSMSGMSGMSGMSAAQPAASASASEDGAAMVMAPGATRPQIVAVTVLTLVALAAGVLLAALYGDMAMRRGMPAGSMAPAGMTMPAIVPPTPPRP